MALDPKTTHVYSTSKYVKWVVAFVLVGPMLWLGLRTQAQDQDRLACNVNGVDLREQTGVVRQTGRHLYLVADSWPVIT